MRSSRVLRPMALALALSAGLGAQPQANEAITVPRLIRFNSSYRSASQQPQAAVVGATFSIYREQYDGTPLWSEIQNVQPGKDGSYTVLLGATRDGGMPLDLFTTSETRWLEVEIDQVRQPRILLGSVPYALKSADADTLGGLPASAYLRASPPSATAVTNTTTNNIGTVVAPGLSPFANSGSPNCVGMFLNTTDLICSTINQNTYAGNPAVSVGGTASLGALTLIGNVPSSDAAGMVLYNQGGGGGASVSLDFYNTPFNGGIPQAKIKAVDDGAYSDHLTFWTKTPGGPNNAVVEKVRITSSGNVGIGTTAPGGKLDVAGNLKVSGSTNGIVFPDGTKQTTAVTSPAGDNNTALGASALASNNKGYDNTASGFQSLFNNTTGALNAATGSNALYSNTTGVANTGMGHDALFSNTTGGENTATGTDALYSNTTGNDNTATGRNALYTNTTGGSNTASGAYALRSNTTGSGNTAAGANALLFNSTGVANTASGFSALNNNTTGFNNTASGYNALLFNTTGNSNTASGYGALSSNTTASSNTAVGAGGLQSNTTGFFNTAAGANALQTNTTGFVNTAVGYGALSANTTGGNNTAGGVNALNSNTTGSANTAFGIDALLRSATGSGNVAFGNNAGYNVASGNNNTAVGTFALGNLGNNTQGGDNNIALGWQAGSNVTTGSNTIDIGNSGAASDSALIRIGTAGTHSAAFIAGIRGVTTGNNDGIPVIIDSQGQLGTISSSRRFKDDIQEMGDSTAGLMRLRPVTFRYKQAFANGSKPIQYGLIAEEVAEVYPELIAHSADGQIETVKYQVLDSMLLNEVQRLHAQNTAQQHIIRSLEERLYRLESLLERTPDATR
jgi:hypothetical protein